jgi:LCP family protein required for cell wall assembly
MSAATVGFEQFGQIMLCLNPSTSRRREIAIISQSHRRQALTWLLVLLCTAGLFAATALSRPFESKGADIKTKDDGNVSVLPPLPGKRITFLVMGVDKRAGDRGRSDMMLVASYDTAQEQLAVVSIARDTWMQIPGHGYDKVNHAYAFGGERLAVRTVERALNIPIDYYVTLSFNGFQRIVDALGGVEIDVATRMYYHDPDDLVMGPDGLVIDIWPGLQPMDGLTLLKYTRFRTDEEGDLGRMRRQQEAIKELMKVAARPATLGRLPQLIPALYETVETDLPLAQIFKLSGGAKEVLTTPLKTGSFDGTPTMIGGVYYLIPELVTQRKAAYEILVGSPPPESFVAKAGQDQAVYRRALAEERAAKPNPISEPAISDPPPQGDADVEPDPDAVSEPPKTDEPADQADPAA